MQKENKLSPKWFPTQNGRSSKYFVSYLPHFPYITFLQNGFMWHVLGSNLFKNDINIPISINVHPHYKFLIVGHLIFLPMATNIVWAEVRI